MTSWVGALHSAMMDLGGPLSAALADRFSCRVALVTSGILYVIGFLATAFAPNIEICIFTCGVVAGLGTAGYTAALVVIGYNFKQKRNVAMGFASAGIGVGMFVMAPIYEVAREFYGNSGFFICLAGITANLTVFGTLYFPSKLERYSQETRKQRNRLKTKENSSLSVIRFYAHVAKQKPVLCLCLCMFCYCLGTHLVFLHLPKYATDMGSTSAQSSYLVSIIGIAGVIGRVLTGIATNDKKIDEILIYAGSMGVVCVATLLFPLFSYSFVGQAGYAIILGLYFGCCYVLTGSVNIIYVGVDSMTAATGVEFFCGGVGSVVGPVLAGAIVDNGGTYEQSFLIAGCFILLACASAVITVAVSSTHDKNCKICQTLSIAVIHYEGESIDVIGKVCQQEKEVEYICTRL